MSFILFCFKKRVADSFLSVFFSVCLPALGTKLFYIMKAHFESEVIIPVAVFGHISTDIIRDLLASCIVRFELKGESDDKCEFFLSSSVRWRLESAIDLLHSLRRLVLASSYSPMDELRCESWLYGQIRIILD